MTKYLVVVGGALLASWGMAADGVEMRRDAFPEEHHVIFGLSEEQVQEISELQKKINEKDSRIERLEKALENLEHRLASLENPVNNIALK